MKKLLLTIAVTLITSVATIPAVHAELGYTFSDAPAIRVGMDTNRENNPDLGYMYIIVALPPGTASNMCEFEDGGNLYGYGGVSDLSDAYATEILSMGKTAIASTLHLDMEVDLDDNCTIMGISLVPGS